MSVSAILAIPAASTADVDLLGSGNTSPFVSFSGGTAETSPALRADMEKLLQRSEAAKAKEREEQQSPAAQKERAKSRTAFDELGDASALAVFREEFASELKPAMPDTEALLDGDRISRFEGDYVAVTEGVGGQPRRLIDSPVPLRAPVSDESGAAKAPIDLDLVSSGDGYVPDTGLADVELPKQADDGIRAGQVTVVPEGDAQVERMDSDTLAYPNVDTDTDLAVNVTPTGFETFHQVRSPDAPEEQRLKLALPAGSELKEVEGPGDTGTGAAVVQRAERTLSISPPKAIDAQGREVASTMKVEGDSLVITTPHRDKALAYPILVDPEFTVKDDWACGWGSTNCTATWWASHGFALEGLKYWDATQTGGGGNWAMTKQCQQYNYNAYQGYFNNCWGKYFGGGPYWRAADTPYYTWQYGPGQTGLHQWAGAGGTNAPLAMATHDYSPPGQTTSVHRADFGATWFQNQTSNTGAIQMVTGIYDTQTGTWAPDPVRGGQAAHTYSANHGDKWFAEFGETATGRQRVKFGLVNLSWGNTVPNNWVHAYMGAAIMSLRDPEAPTLVSQAPTGATGANGWFKAGNGAADTATFTAQAADPGLGLRRFRLTNSANANLGESGIWCNGGKGLPCAAQADLSPSYSNQHSNVDAVGQAHAAPIRVAANSLPEGSNTLTLTAVDALGEITAPGEREHASRVPHTVKVDKADPEVEIEGTMAPEDRDWVGAGDQSLFISGLDTGSGVTEISAKLDGNPLQPATTAPCPAGGCDLQSEVIVPTDDMNPSLAGDQPLSEGNHVVRVEVKDVSGRVTPREWTIRHDRQAPALALSGELVDRQGQTLAEDGQYSMSASASEAQATGPRSGLGMISIQVDDGDDAQAIEQRCIGGACTLTRNYTYNAGDYPQGPHEMKVTATDYAGNETVRTVSINNPSDPEPNCQPTASTQESSSSDATTTSAATSLLQSAQGLPQAFGSITSINVADTLISPTLAPASGDMWKSAQSFTGTSVDRLASDGTFWSVNTVDGPVCASPTVVGRDASPASSVIDGALAGVANVRSGTDSFFRPTATGLQSFLQLRSAAAPQTFSWTLDLPPETSLVKLSDGSVAVARAAEAGTEAPILPAAPGQPSGADQRGAIRNMNSEIDQAGDLRGASQRISDGDVLAVIRRPWAKDASGGTIATSYDVTGSTLTLNVDQSSQPAYPITAGMYADDAEAVDEADAARKADQGPAVDEDADTAEADARPSGSGTAPTASSAGASSSASAADYPDEGSGSEPSGVPDSRDETPEGASAPDPTASMSDSAFASAFGGLTIGTTEANGSTLLDSRLKDLGKLNPKGRSHVRVFVPWNFMAIKDKVESGQETRGCYRRAVRTWDGRKNAAGALVQRGYRQIASTLPNTEVMVVFTSQPVNCPRIKPPSVKDYEAQVAAFMNRDDPDEQGKEHGFVDRYTPWNEPNFTPSAIRSRPDLGARYWKVVNALCGGDKCLAPVAGDVAAGKSFLKKKVKRNGQTKTVVLNYAKEYRKAMVRVQARTKLPVYWAFHAYGDYKTFALARSKSQYQPRQTDQYRKLFATFTYRKGNDEVAPSVWNTEAGAFYRMDCEILDDKSRCKSRNAIRFGETLQAKALAFLLKASVRPIPGDDVKVSRIYYFNFQDVVGDQYESGYGQSGRCETSAAVSPAGPLCSLRDTGLIGSPSVDDPRADTAKNGPVTDYPRRSPSLGSSNVRRKAWCLLRFRKSGEIKSGTVGKCPTQ